MRISDRLKKLKPSATLAVNAKAQELKAQGRDIVSLAVGEPDFGTPGPRARGRQEAIDDGFTRYTPVPGIPDLRAAIAGYYAQTYGVCAKPENAIATCGGKQALYNLLMALLNPGDEVLIPRALLGELPRHGGAGRRRARHRAHHAGERLPRQRARP